MKSEAKNLIKQLGSIEAADDYLMNKESNDCVVRAIKHAFDVNYSDAHHFCETKLHRVSGDGTYTGRYLPLVNQAFGKKISPMGKKFSNSNSKNRRLTRDKKTKVEHYSQAKRKIVTKRIIKKVPFKVSEFIKKYNEGNFIVTVKRHAFAVIDGVIIGNWRDDKRLGREVVSAYKIK